MAVMKAEMMVEPMAWKTVARSGLLVAMRVE